MSLKEKIANGWLWIIILSGVESLLIWMVKNPISFVILFAVIMTIWSIKTIWIEGVNKLKNN